MAMRKLEEKNIRKLTRLGKTSLVVSIPVEIIKSLGWGEKQRVTVKKINGAVVIRDYRNK